MTEEKKSGSETETMDDIKKIDIYELLAIEPEATEQEVSFFTRTSREFLVAI